MAVKLSPVYQDAQLDSSGNPYVGAQLFTFAAGSTTKQTAYQDSAGNSAHTNPIILNARGEPPAPIWLTVGQTYKFFLATPTEPDPPVTPIRTIDNVTGVNDTTLVIDQWVAGPAPTYVSATQFTLSGDQTSAFHVGRRLKTTNSGGTVYSTITVSAFGALTTITVVNDDAGVLDSGLSAVSYGLLSADGPSGPAVTPGTRTNNSAATGQVGEYVSSTVVGGSAVSLTTGTDADITSISLTAGDWDVWGTVATFPNAATTTSFVVGWISTTSATLPTTPNNGSVVSLTVALSAGVSYAGPVGMTRLSLASTTTVYLSTRVGFAVNTMGGYGFIGARRRR